MHCMHNLIRNVRNYSLLWSEEAAMAVRKVDWNVLVNEIFADNILKYFSATFQIFNSHSDCLFWRQVEWNVKLCLKNGYEVLRATLYSEKMLEKWHIFGICLSHLQHVKAKKWCLKIIYSIYFTHQKLQSIRNAFSLHDMHIF